VTTRKIELHVRVRIFVFEREEEENEVKEGGRRKRRNGIN
jgi:hypothetical protein